MFLKRALLIDIFAICDPSSAILLVLQIKKPIWAIMHGSIGSLPLKYVGKRENISFSATLPLSFEFCYKFL